MVSGADIQAVQAVFLLLLVFVAMFAGLARRLKVPYPILLVIAGLLLSFLPGMPRIGLDPDLVFLVFLPRASKGCHLMVRKLIEWALNNPLVVVFLATGLAFGRLTSLFARVRRRLVLVNLVSGVALVAFGVMLLTNNLHWLSSVSADVLRAVGLGRLTVS